MSLKLIVWGIGREVFQRKKNRDLTESEKRSLNQFLTNDNLQKFRDISPSVIAATLCFIIYSVIFNNDHINFSNVYFAGTSLFLLLTTANYLLFRNSKKTGPISLYLFILILLLFCSALGGYLYKVSGDLVLVLTGFFLISAVFSIRKIISTLLLMLGSIIFLSVVYMSSSSINELLFTLREFTPYILISLTISFYTYETRAKNHMELIKEETISYPVDKNSKEILEVLYKISNAVHTTYLLEDFLSDVHKILSSIMNVKNFFVVITEGKSIKCPFFVDQYDDYKEVFNDLDKLKKFSIAGHIIQNRKAMVLHKEEMLQLAKDHGAEITGKLSEIYVGIPLKISNEVIGVIAMQDYHDPKAFSKNDIKLLNLVSKQIALTIERKRNEIKLRDGERNFRMLIENTTDIILKTDNKLNFVYISPSAESFTGYTIRELYKKKLSDWIIEKDREKFTRIIMNELAATPKDVDSTVTHRTFDQLIKVKDGSTKWIDLRYKFVTDENNNVHVLAILRDISLRKNYEMNLLYQVNHDNLTNLHNRKAFIDELKKTIDYASRYNEKRVILFIDIDNFKTVNDTFGHGKGDLILQEISQRLKSVLRKTDFLARLGGDEFTVILNSPSLHNKQSVIDKIQQTISAPYLIDETSIDYISASIGVSVYPDDGTDHETLISYADSEMYSVKDEKSRSWRNKDDD